MTFQIYDFNHDDKASGGKAPITFGMKNVAKSSNKMHTSNTSAGGWNACYMRNTVMPTYFDKMPLELKRCIEAVNKYTTNGTPDYAIITSVDKLWIPSAPEVGKGEFSGEGTQYPIYTNDTSRKKRNYTGEYSAEWWTRSADDYNKERYVHIASDGKKTNAGASANFQIVLCFCI